LSLTKYIHQVKPREESYVNHVDRIQDLLSEAKKPQQGYVYEKNAAAVLKLIGIVPQNFHPAGAGSDIPDLKIQKKGVNGNKPTGCELKISAADAGSLVIKYVNGKWEMGSIVTTDKKSGKEITNDEKKFMKELAEEVDLIGLINEKWKEEPYRGGTSDKIMKEKSKLTSRQRYERDLNTFKDIRGEIPATKIEEYYNKKNTYYVNVGTHGFYLLGTSNPLKLKGTDKPIPRFGTSATAKFRARCQYKSENKSTGNVSYQFTLMMIFSIPAAKKSDHNIAPIISKTDVKIDTNKLKLDWFLK
tara:strand:+ start:137 stop:1042 length:906 start_codon:yes stop_codon:yes gene_type:complete